MSQRFAESPREPAVRPDLRGWDAGWKGLRAVVTGLGVSGFAAADTLAELGVSVVVVDSQDTQAQRERADTLRIVGVEEILLGEQHTHE
ncbi:MAG TPA: FAD-dependent monooxygenase, partial [Candidatus Nesterenkonia stercoripullorum]|nr:FAD-dependent monooxygenase [Candidatus Nesterenkonia stercoripullorum]